MENLSSKECIINEFTERQKKAKNVIFYNDVENRNSLQTYLDLVKSITKQITKKYLSIVKVDLEKVIKMVLAL